jgi:hypothetical protein
MSKDKQRREPRKPKKSKQDAAVKKAALARAAQPQPTQVPASPGK